MADYPALPLWTDAYMADTMHMSCLESGAYLHLLMAAWRSPGCTLTDDDKMLGRMARCTPREWAKVRPVVMNFWTHDGETKTWSQKRLLRELEYLRDKSRKAKLAAEAKHLKDKQTGNADAPSEQPTEQATGTCSEAAPDMPPIPTPIPNKEDSCVVTREPVSLHPGTAFIKAFDEERARAFGAERAREYPNQLDLGTAQRWIESGVSPEMARNVFAADMTKKSFTGKQPPGTLSYYDQSMADALANSKRPMPEGKITDADLTDIPAHLDARKGKRRSSDSFDAAVAAARSIVVGE